MKKIRLNLSLLIAMPVLLLLAPMARAATMPITLVNGSFQYDTAGRIFTTKVSGGFDVTGKNVAGWLDSGTTYKNSGVDYVVEKSNFAEGGNSAAFCGSGDSGAYQITSYQMVAGNTLTLTWWATSSWAKARQMVKLLSGTSTSSAFGKLTPLATSTSALNNAGNDASFTQYTLTYTPTPADAGHYLAVSFAAADTTGGSWAMFRNFGLSVVSNNVVSNNVVSNKVAPTKVVSNLVAASNVVPTVAANNVVPTVAANNVVPTKAVSNNVVSNNAGSNSIVSLSSTNSTVSAANSTLSPNLTSITANGASTQVITVQSNDIFRNNETSGGATVVFTLTGPGTISPTIDNGDGTYSATLTAPTSVGTAVVTATLNGSPVGTSLSASQTVATYFSSNIGDPVPNLTTALTTNFTTGGAAFKQVYYPSTGLGPVYNNVACSNCHNFPVTGGGGSSLSTRFGSSVNGVFNPLTSLGGTLLHSAYINANCVETLPTSANVTALRRVRALFGAGLIEAIPDSVIENNATQPNVDNIVGAVAFVTDPVDGNVHAGRFGWKGQYASLLAFAADAENNEIGLTNRFEPTGHAPNGNVALYNQYNTLPNPKDVINSTSGKANCDLNSDYIRLLGPAPTVPLTATAQAGQALFFQISCDECHTPTLTTSAAFVPISDLASETSAPITALSNISVPLYSDLLLHNMGTLNDGIAQGGASPNQMMTAPLWGLRYKVPYLHNGSATNSVDAAIRAHAGDAAAAESRYANLTATQQQDLVAFLNSL